MTTGLRVVIPTWNSDRALELAKQLETHAATPPFIHIATPQGNGVGNKLLLPLLVDAFKTTEQMNPDVTLVLHDDVQILPSDKPWDVATTEAFFFNPTVGLVGWGGATGLGHKDLYKVPYRLEDLARENYASATTDWKEHGDLLTAPREVAVLDGFALAFRREAYEEMGGWRAVMDMGAVFHFYDTISCLLMHRLGWKVMAVPVPCRHLGGRTSTTPEYQELLKSLGYENDLEVHRKTSRLVYDEFSDVLPVRV